MTVFIYKDTKHNTLKVFASAEAAEEWFRDNDPEGVAFGYEVEGENDGTTRNLMSKAPLDIIAENLPTYADCYVNPTHINLPTIGRLTKDAAHIMAALAAEGFQITRVEEDRS